MFGLTREATGMAALSSQAITCVAVLLEYTSDHAIG
jgi:hypothetical protein